MINSMLVKSEKFPPQILAESGLGLRKIKLGLIGGLAKSDSGETVYLGFEQIFSNDYWDEYARSLRYPNFAADDPFPYTFVGPKLMGTLLSLAESSNLPKYPDGISEIFESEKEYNDVITHLKTQGSGKLLASLMLLEDGLRGFFAPCTGSSTLEFVVYASKTPIEDYQFNKPLRPLKNFSQSDEKEFYLKHCNILMCFKSATKPGSISFTHVGIFGSPFRFLEPSNRFKGISMILHGFAAQVESLLSPAKLMVNRPVRIMRDIMLKKIGKENTIDSNEGKENFLKKYGLGLNAIMNDGLNHKTVGDHCLTFIVDLAALAKVYQQAYYSYAESVVPVEKKLQTVDTFSAPPLLTYNFQNKIQSKSKESDKMTGRSTKRGHRIKKRELTWLENPPRSKKRKSTKPVRFGF